MKKHLSLLPLFAAIPLMASAGLADLMPKPKIVESAAAKPITLTSLTDLKVTTRIVDSIPGAYDYPLAGFPCETYTLTVGPDGALIEAVTPTGLTRGRQTLAQLADSAPGTVTIAQVRIVDWPAYKLRGFMHDCGRSYISMETLKRQIDLLSSFKVNLFHFHLTENQAWRFESKLFPQLTADSTMVRHPGQFYTQEECRELEEYAAERGVTVLPEIDMPGHSAAFTRAMGFDMQTDEGVSALLQILEEVAAAFPRAPYIHIGADEKSITYPGFLRTMTDKVHSLGRLAVCWNPIKDVAITPDLGFDMTQMWSTRGKAVEGIPNIDCRYTYANHFDTFADVAGIFRSNIYYTDRGNADIAGAVTAFWNDRRLPSEEAVTAQNNLYAAVLASAERAWTGGGAAYIEEGGAGVPLEGEELAEFADWERRFLHHKATTLASEPVPYVAQTDIVWALAGPYPLDADPGKFTADSTLTRVRGAGVYLRHPWGKNVPGVYADPQPESVAYARTYIHSPRQMEVDALIEFYNYSRSERDLAPEAGAWDRRGSSITLNGAEIPSPICANAAVTPVTHETDLLDENLAGRPPVRLHLREGLNEVTLRLPFTRTEGIRLQKWMYTFAIPDAGALGFRYSSDPL